MNTGDKSLKAKKFLYEKLAITFPHEPPWWCDMVAEIMQEYADKQNKDNG